MKTKNNESVVTLKLDFNTLSLCQEWAKSCNVKVKIFA